MSKKVLIIMIVLVVIAGGVFYLLMRPVEVKKSGSVKLFQDTEPPTLFSKEDYKIEEKPDGKYIVVEKVGLSCRVPEGWRIEKVGCEDSESSCLINLTSPDAEVFGVLRKGCGISIMAGIAKESVEETKRNIELIKESPGKSDEIREDYEFEIIEISNYQALKWTEPEMPNLGHSTGVDIPVGADGLLNLGARLPSEYKEICSPIWEEFLASVSIK